ncbi:unnamed protein product [Gongylonema pulchrum]|uniref:Gal_mutarotas_2 domain-containing protein n=1 Tax=Gongylonema pulchrum TaxID=637853 RepID=A0A183ENC1_9BILA|nr:unnamed protein product [Gongylonema pulchrum]
MLRGGFSLDAALVLLLFWAHITAAVDRTAFRRCEQSGFCKRHRTQVGQVKYTVSDVTHNGTALMARLQSTVNTLRLVIVQLNDSTLRFKSIEIGKDSAVLITAQDAKVLLTYVPFRVDVFEKDVLLISIGKDSAVLITAQDAKVLLSYVPFRVDVFEKDVLLISVNPNNALKFEHFRKKEDGNETEAEAGFWEEDFRSIHDPKPFGSSSVGIDLSFIGYKFIYGLPEHADSFALRSTAYVLFILKKA